jgi:hypothetical protein
MPILGKDFQRPKEEQAKTREIEPVSVVVYPSETQNKIVLAETKLIPTWLIHPSKILETEYDKEVIESSMRDGIRYPIIVRPCMCEFLAKNHYEIVDGHSRHTGRVTSEKLLCQMVELTDEEVLHEMYILETKGRKSAYWKAMLIGKMVEIKQKELKDRGIDKGAKKEVAKIINRDNIESGQAIVSQYLKIYELFKYLKTLTSLSDGDLMRIKSLDKDNLLELNSLDRGLLPQVLGRWKENLDKSIREIRRDIIARPSYPSRTGRPKRPRKERYIETKPAVLTVPVTEDLLPRIRRIMFWIEDMLSKDLKETKLHWTKRDKILRKFVEKEKRTMLEIAQECLLMGIEDIEHGTEEGSINLCFESVSGVPIGYKGIFKERPR